MKTTETRADLATKLRAVGHGVAASATGNPPKDEATAMALGAAANPALYQQYRESLPGSVPVKHHEPPQR